MSKAMFIDHDSPTENRSRIIESVVVFTLTVGLFFLFGYNEEFRYPIKPPSLSRQILYPIFAALLPSALLLGTLYVTSYFKSRLVAWGIYAIGFFLVTDYYFPNFHDLLFSISN